MIIRIFVPIFILLASQLVHSAGPDKEASRIIDELGLRSASEAISSHPGWAPRKVLVTAPPAFTQVLPGYPDMLREAAGRLEVVIDDSGAYVPDAALLKDVDALIGLCRPQTVANAPRLFWLHSYFVGMDDCAGLSAGELEGKVFTNGKRLSGPAIAEHSIAMLMSLVRGLPAYHQGQMESRWDRNPARQVRFGELKGKTLLVVGLGGIGTEVAWRAHGLGMRVEATRNSSRSGPDFVSYVGLSDELLTLAARADVVVNALPLTTKTTGLFDKAFFEAVKPGAIFISVGRGQSTVTADLVAALQSGKLYGAGLDVTDPEPLPEDSPLWAMSNVIITPHISASGADSLRRGAVIAVENLRRYAAGEALLNSVDMTAGY